MLGELPDAVLTLLPRSGRPLNRWDDNGLFRGLTMRRSVGEMYPRISLHIRKLYVGNGEGRPGRCLFYPPLDLGHSCQSLLRVSVPVVYKPTKAGARTLNSPSEPCLDQV